MKKTIDRGRKLITLLSVLSILTVSMFSVLIGVDFTAVAEAPANVEIWGGYDDNIKDTMFVNGSGTATDPYLISNGDELWKMVKNYGNTEGSWCKYNATTGAYVDGDGNPVTPAYYKLANDIYLNDVSSYDSWGSDSFDMSTLNNWAADTRFSETTFYGKFDGNGHTIYGLYVNDVKRSAFIANVGKDASVKNVHFRNSYILNTYSDDSSDYNIQANGCAAVINAYCVAGDGNDSSIDFTIANCSVIDAYVESKFLCAGLIGYSDGTIPSVKNCIIADTNLNATQLGVEGAVINETWGPQNASTIEGVISVGNPMYGTTKDNCWNGYKVPLVSFKYFFTDCYSDVKHTFEYKHSSFGNISYTDDEIVYTKLSRIKGENAKEYLDLDWEHNWKTVKDDYPIPQNEYIVPTGDTYYENGGPKSSEDVWDGKAAKTFAAGTGTVSDPYLIETCEQFYKMVSTLNANAYYKIADGVKALYFNDVKGKSYEAVRDYLADSKRAKMYNPGLNNFSGYFDGNGVTIYGVKAVNELYAGLFPQAGSSTIKNFTIKNSYIQAIDDDAANTKVEGAAAVVADLSAGASVNLRNIAVVDCFVNSLTKAAGLVACSHTGGCVFIDDCIVSGGSIMSDAGTVAHAAFVAGANSGTHIIKNSIALSIYPAADNQQSYGSSFINVYTDFDAPSSLVAAAAEGVKLVETDALKGTAVKATASQFDWEEAWGTTTDIPMPKIHVSVLGTQGEAWSGKIADGYAGGNGTRNNPYQIDTPERLAQMLAYCNPGAYYELTASIYINDINDSDWQDNAINWLTSKDVTGFTGILDGNGHEVYGLYYDDVKSGVYAGLVPVLGSGGEIRNVELVNAKLNGSEGAVIGAVVGAVEENAINTAVVRACRVAGDVIFSGKANVGGIVGRVGFTRLRMDNSIFEGNISSNGTTGGLVGEVVGKLEIKESISAVEAPFVSAENVEANAVYTSADCSVDGVTVLEIENMIGENAKTYMTGLDFANNLWVTTSDCPIPTGSTKSFDGVQGEAWTGEIATKFSGGAGTEAEPYLVATGEQLALALTAPYNTQYIKLIADIYLNDVSDELWAARVGCESWFTNHEMTGSFKGVFDGDGYAVFGMHFDDPGCPTSTYIGLFPHISDSAQIKNVGISHAYINANITDNNVYAGGLFGMGGGFYGYSFYSEKTKPDATVNDEFLIPGESSPRKLPSFTNCFVDHNSYISAYNVGGIGCPGGAVIVVRNCYVTATLMGGSSSSYGTLIGNQWSMGSRLYNSLALPQNDVKSSAGTHQWVSSESNICFYHENVYYYGSVNIFGTIRVTRPQWRIGEEAKTAMPNLDWENTWRVEKDGTPVLRIFDKDDRSAGIFSDKSFNIPDVQINLMTGDTSIVIDPLVGKPYEKVTLPTLTRQGYIFTGWYSFPDYTLEYPYEYFLSRDINLYAGWKKNGIIQDFEDYIYSTYDCDITRWNYNKPGSRGGYNFDYVHTGTKSMQLLDNSAESADLLIHYEEWLTVGQNYTMTFWVATDTADNPPITLSFVHNNHPDYLNTAVLVEPMVTLTGLSVGEWKQYSFSFTAQTNWASIRATGNSSLFIDDIIIAPTGTIISNNNYVNGDLSTISPSTSDSALTVTVLIATIISCAVILIVSKRNFSEVIDKN